MTIRGRRAIHRLAVALLGAVAACGGDDPGPEAGLLTASTAGHATITAAAESNHFGDLGTGAAAVLATTPQPVFGGLTFSSLTAGQTSTCAVAQSGTRCWGQGPLGNALSTSSNIPALVSGGQVFDRLSLGGAHACGISSAGRTFCWGSTAAIGAGDPYPPLPVSLAPAAVVGQP